jgi:hypothetical protein
MDGFELPITIIIMGSMIYALQLWIRHQRRLMVHRERLAAIEKGIELPPLEREIQRGSWNVQRLLLFAGLVWISLGIAAFLLLFDVAGTTFHIPDGYDQFGNKTWMDVMIPRGAQWAALAPLGIGISHVIVYLVGKQKEARAGDDET